ncbi:hypothetical protein BDD12DRAFT_344857 [Trichophaea hybrida]|nr:hypothetical protein BDD12DRAFT_344857 [Trichophaea hybrida]
MGPKIPFDNCGRRLHIDLQATSIQSSGNDCRSWLMTVSVDHKPLNESLRLKDPFDAIKKADCRWYLEQYTQKSPFSIIKAQIAAGWLLEYPKALLDQLQLKDLVDLHVPEDNSQKLYISIDISEDTVDNADSDSTIHQLHWELVEDPSLWTRNNVEVIVRRYIRPPEPAQGSTNQIQSWPLSNEPGSSINILLVVARDTSSDPAVYSDVNPFTVLDIFIRLRNKLKAAGSSVRLNVEVVRQGTLQSLEQHLERSKILHGPAYFHIVHFDLHGAVRTPKGKSSKAAYLYFSSPNSNSIKPEPAKKVGNLLTRYQVPFTVLNSCESARANAGDDANIAKIFEREGIQSVLAMSFKVSSYAVEIFLQAFYYNLLIGKLRFSVAAGKARQALRSSPVRYARLGTKRQMCDWFVPVLYSRDKDLVCISPGTAKCTLELEPVGLEKLAEHMVGSKVNLPTRVVGREFDLLRFEKMLLLSRSVYLHGPAGAGKTAFLKHACSLWQETSFVDVIIYIDFEKNGIHSATDLADAILRELLFSSGQKYNTRLWPLRTSRRLHTISLITELLSKLRVVMIFDGLHTSHIDFGRRIVPGCLTESAASDINRFLKNILVSNLDSPERQYIIFVGRCPDPCWISLPSLRLCSFELRGLELADSIDLAKLVLRNRGWDVDNWTHSDLDSLELVVNLLQGLPAAILEIPLLVNQLKNPSREFYDSVHRGIIHPRTYTEPENSTYRTIFHELQHLYSVLPDNIMAPLLCLAIYWHEGPYVSSWSRDMVSYGLCFEEAQAESAVALARDRGFLEVGTLGAITLIHPLFTVYARSLAFTIAESAVEMSTRIGTPLVRSVFQWVQSRVQSRFDSRPKSVKGAQLTLAALGINLCYNNLTGAAYVNQLMKAIEMSSVMQTLAITLRNLDFGEMRSYHIGALPNVITCINICVSSDPGTPIDKWPVLTFMRFAAIIRLVGTPAEIKLSANRYEELLESIIKLSGGVAADPQYLQFALNMSNYLASTHRCDVSLLHMHRRHGEFVHLATDIITASARKYGETSDPFILYEQACTLRHQILCLIEKGHRKEAVEMWEKFLELDERVFTLCKQYLPTSLVLIDEIAIHVLSSNEDDAATMRIRAERFNAYSIPQAFYECRKLSLKFITAAAESSNCRNELTDKMLSAITSYNPEFEKVSQGYKDEALTGLENDAPWRPENKYLASFSGLSRRYDDPLHRIYDLEVAVDSGNWVTVIEHHNSFLREALQDLRFDDALEHIDVLIEISRKDPVFLGVLEAAKVLRRIFSHTVWDIMRTVPSANGPVGGAIHVQPILAALEEIIDMLHERECQQTLIEYLRDSQHIWKEAELSATMGLRLFRTISDNEVELEMIMRKMIRKSDNEEYLNSYIPTC